MTLLEPYSEYPISGAAPLKGKPTSTPLSITGEEAIKDKTVDLRIMD
ncbi:MAG: hypothetical protein WDM90_18620 [Ferruginibacter sp.]